MNRFSVAIGLLRIRHPCPGMRADRRLHFDGGRGRAALRMALGVDDAARARGCRWALATALNAPFHKETSQADDAAGEFEEAQVQVGAYLVPDAKALELVEPGKGAFYHPAGLAQSRAMRGTTSGDHRFDPSPAKKPAVLVEVVAAVGEQSSGTMTGASAPAPAAGNGIE